jgi:hypothetical protein
MYEQPAIYKGTSNAEMKRDTIEGFEDVTPAKPHLERPSVEQRIRAGLASEHGVAWVRISDLISTEAGRIAGRGIDLESELARRLRHPAAGGRAIVNRRSALPPLDAFGRRTQVQGRDGLGRR